jgi:cell wall-associated NlpC family hydrolase
MKQIIFTFLLLFLLASCKSTQTISDFKNENRTKNSTVEARNLKNARGQVKKEATETNIEEVPQEYAYNANSEEEIPYIAYEVLERANEYYGVKYRMGGNSRAGIDCSGLVVKAFESTNIKLPRTSVEMSRMGRRLQNYEVRKGDLIFFKTRGGRNVNHVGLVVENKDGEIKFIHASNSQGVTLSSLNETYYQKSFSHCNRIL